MELDIIKLFGFTFKDGIKDNILEWNENFIQDHFNCVFGKLEEVFCKCFQTAKNDEEVYSQLKNIQQQIVECVEVYYEQLFKFTNCL